MPDRIQYEDNELFNPETAHEHSDVPVRPLFWFIVIFIVFAIACHVAVTLLYKGLATAERERMDPPQTQVARPADADVPRNQPLLQPFPRRDAPPQNQTPVTDMEDMRRAENEVLHSYAWVDKQHGLVRIPIEEAKKAYAARAAVQSQTGSAAVTTTNAATTTAAPPSGAPASSPAGPAPSPAPRPTGATEAATTTGGHQ